MGVGFILVYIVVAITLPDHLPHHWAFQIFYFVLAGIAWVFPVRWLMLWAVGKR
jgi:hypothetical protein